MATSWSRVGVDHSACLKPHKFNFHFVPLMLPYSSELGKPGRRSLWMSPAVIARRPPCEQSGWVFHDTASRDSCPLIYHVSQMVSL